MTIVYISPSNQTDTWDGTEQSRCERVADHLIAALAGTSIHVIRANPGDKIATRAKQANAANVNAYVAIHTDGSIGHTTRGITTCVFPGSSNGQRLGSALHDAVMTIYPGPSRGISGRADLVELADPDAPASLIELGFHDQPDDRAWMENNIPAIGQALADGLRTYFGVNPTPAPTTKQPVSQAPVSQGETPLEEDSIIGPDSIGRYQKHRGLPVTPAENPLGGPQTVKDMQDLANSPEDHDGWFDGQDPVLMKTYWPNLVNWRPGGQGSAGVRAYQANVLGTDPDGLLGPNDALRQQQLLNKRVI